MKILITGGSGNLGRFLCTHLEGEDISIAYTYRTKKHHSEAHKGYLVNFENGDGLEACLKDFDPDVVVNCAAIAKPIACQKNPEVATKINDCTHLLSALKDGVLVIHISTDLVYDGDNAPYKEDDDLKPVNVYGSSKVAAEKNLKELWPKNHVCLRSSMIYGPVPEGLKSTHFTDFVDSVLSEGKKTDFFHDEYRSPTFIGDFVTSITAILAKTIKQSKTVQEAGLKQVYNLGGETLSRLQMATQLCEYRGYNPDLVVSVSAASIDRGVTTPKNTGMDCSLIAKDLGFAPTTFGAGLKECFPKNNKKQKTG